MLAAVGSHHQMAEVSLKPDAMRGISVSEVRTLTGMRDDMSLSGHRPVPSLGTLMNIKRRMAKWRTRRQDNLLGSTKSSTAVQGPRIRMENSFALGPRSDERFSEDKVKKIISDVLRFFLADGLTYDPKHCAKLACLMTEEIKSRVKELRYTRYKVVAYVVIGKVNGQGSHVASRGLWDTANDGMASVKMTIQDMFAVGVVFATYFE